ncbi:MAG: hypothetical protein ACRDYE_03790 [Acidimicrobiales bacterium]
MATTAGKRVLRLAVLAALIPVVARLVESASRRRGGGGSAVIGGDTWPPVPIKPMPPK